MKYKNKESRISQEDIAQLKKKANKGDVDAQFKLASRFNIGDGVERDYTKALKWLRVAESKGHIEATLIVARIYENGDEHVKQNLLEAMERYLRIEAKSPIAQYRLGKMYEDGRGVEKNELKAKAFYRKASKKYKLAAEALKNLSLHDIANEQTRIISLDESKPSQNFAHYLETNKMSSPPVSLFNAQYVQVDTDGQQTASVEHHHTVVREPKNISPPIQWECREPEPGQKWAKEHQAHKCDPALGMYFARRRGRSHEHDAKFCDDDGDFWQHESGWTVLVVADGAGSAAFSREGSHLAVTTVIDEFQQWFTREHASELDALLGDWQQKHNVFYQLFYYKYYDICKKIITKIHALADTESINIRQFATTLLVTVSKTIAGKTYLTSLWIGDGAIVAYLPGASRLLGAADSGTYVGQTRFLDASYLQQHFASSVYLAAIEQVEALILMTDGVSDPKFKSDVELIDAQCWDDFWQEIAPELAKETPDLALLEWLHFFERGYHDDRTLLISRNQGINT
ncbi:protein phosphatase 2C domain-containing protein [Klebsiella sp. MPUS7]|uniref:protein phosphatase 2C domain-containing protein n=1 Tax=Klebsiella sp. MPUS7 TaxID=2697371 RepID=UPI001362252F|nr:protein phosphatase 2C domain-containing protein [Klebsiella sp. MPUS7]QHI89957.1 hypothetical protein GUC22_24810 [Klebsiella sp. MPUS7]